MKAEVFIHPMADVKTKEIGDGTRIWQCAIVLQGAVIGARCNINAHTFIEDEVIIGNDVTIKCGVYIWNRTQIEDGVFVGPNVTFTNEKYPRSKNFSDVCNGPILKKGCSIGANATIVCGNKIGKYALIGAGAVVTKEVKAYALVVGNPSKQIEDVDF